MSYETVPGVHPHRAEDKMSSYPGIPGLEILM